MKTNGITFSALREFLLALGFSENAAQNRMTFVYPTTGTYLLFRPYGAEERVTDRDIAGCSPATVGQRPDRGIRFGSPYGKGVRVSVFRSP